MPLLADPNPIIVKLAFIWLCLGCLTWLNDLILDLYVLCIAFKASDVLISCYGMISIFGEGKNKIEVISPFLEALNVLELKQELLPI